MWQRTMALGRAQVVVVVAELGVADALAGGKATAAQLARSLEVDEDALHRVLRAAADDGVLRLDRRGRFALTRLGATLRSDAQPSMRPWARYLGLESTRAAWADLGESVRTGDAAFPRVHGTSVWSWFADHPEEEQLFAAAMQAMTEFEAPDACAVGAVRRRRHPLRRGGAAAGRTHRWTPLRGVPGSRVDDPLAVPPASRGRTRRTRAAPRGGCRPLGRVWSRRHSRRRPGAATAARRSTRPAPGNRVGPECVAPSGAARTQFHWNIRSIPLTA